MAWGQRRQVCRRQVGNTEAKVPTSVIPIQALNSWFLLKQRAGPFPGPPSPTSRLSLWGKFFSEADTLEQDLESRPWREITVSLDIWKKSEIISKG